MGWYYFWASSKPVELELWHSYNSSIGADTEHGQPITAPYGNGTIAFALLHEGRYFEIYHRPPLQLSGHTASLGDCPLHYNFIEMLSVGI
jgi:hypothetical protein